MRPDVVEYARAWIGTPYRHQANCKGAGADCLGLVRGIWVELYGTEPETVPQYSRDWAEPDRIEALRAAATRHLTPVDDRDAAVGDVLLFRMRDGHVAKHLGILSSTAPAQSFIHSYEHHGVIESPLSRPWARRVVARFEFPKGA